MTELPAGFERTLDVGDVVPWFQLPTTSGGHIRSTSFRGRSNLVLIVLSDMVSASVRTFLSGVTRRHDEFEAVHAKVIVVSGGALAAAIEAHAARSFGYPIAMDERGRTISRLRCGDAVGESPLVLITDRYLEVRVRKTGWAALSEPGVTDLLEWLRYIDSLCSV